MTRTLKPVAVLVLMASLATCRLDKLITPSTADIRLSLAADTVGIADSVRLVAVVTVDGKQNQALRVEWSTSAPDTATVDSSGLVRGILRGRATITARVENALFLPAPISDTAVLSVVVPRVTIAPDSTTLTSVGDSVCLTAVALDAGGGTVPGVAVAFAVTADPDTTLTQRATPGCYGARKGGAPARVRAFVDIAADTATVTVRQVAATLTVTPDSIRFYTQTRQRTLSAAAIDSGGSPIPAPSIVWTSADTNVAPVAPTGTVTARSNGTTWVHAQSGTARDSTRVVVQQVAASIAVAPGSDTLQTVRGRDTLFATVRDSADRVIGAASPVWTSLSPDSVRIVTYGGNSATIEAVAEGSATIVAQDTVGGQVLTATAQVTVRYQIVSLQISPAAATLVAIGDTVRFTATGRDANDSIVAQPRAAWRAADTLRVRIDSVTGLATARNPGATNVIARRDAVADTAAATVTPPVLSVDTMAFVDSMLRSSPDSVSVIRTVGNTGAGTLGAHLAIVHGASWLSVTPDTVNIPASGSTSIRLTARAGSLSEATYFDTVRVQSAVAAGSPKNIPVRFTVYCPLVTIAPDTAHAAGLAASDCGARHQAGSFADYYRFTGVAGDTIRIAMTTSPTSIDTYLYLLDGAGAVVASNDNCPGALNSCLQFVVPAAGPYTIEATSFTAGAAFPYTLGLTHPRAPAAPTALGQFANDTMIAVGDSANTGTIEFRATGQDVNPRDTLRLQVEVRRLAAGFTGAP
ncbi:MAG TPA: Ig-like domain-containing protein, partial [Gemmatimonadales bacterium]|nr:Ig-like domain-containing protein [Gemmatimonadales bacterium]